MAWKISEKLTQPEVDHYIHWLDHMGYRSMEWAVSYDVRSCQMLEKLFGLLRRLRPVSESGARSLWIRARRGDMEDFAKHYGSYEELLGDGSVQTREQYVNHWKSMFPDDVEWYELTAVEEPEIDYRGVFLHHRYVLELDGRKEACGPAWDVSPFLEWLLESVEFCMEALEAGIYNTVVRQELPPMHRTGTISRKDLWRIYPESKKEYFSKITQNEIEFFLADGVSDRSKVGRLKKMTANDFFRFCALGYKANGYSSAGLSPREQYLRYADGRHGGLTDIAPDSPAAFAAWYAGEERLGAHPWEVCRGGNSTHVDLYVLRDEKGYCLCVAGTSTWRSVEAIKFFLALHHAGLPVVIQEAELLKARLLGTEKIGIVPHGVTPAYCQSYFPNEKIEIFENLSDERAEEMAALCSWQPVPPVEFPEMENFLPRNQKSCLSDTHIYKMIPVRDKIPN